MAIFTSPFGGTKRKPLFGKATEPESVYAPYIPKAKEEEEKKRKKIGPIQWIFDRLSTGQYVVANAVDEIIESAKDGDPTAKDVVDVLKAMGEGITGKRKGDFAEVLKKRLPASSFTETPIMSGEDEITQVGGIQERFDEGKLGSWLKDRREGRSERGGFMSQATGADVVGFLLNVFADPLTYVSFGATKGAQAAAKAVADDTAKLVAKAIGKSDDVAKAAVQSLKGVSDDILDTAIKGYSHARFKELLKQSPDAASKYFNSFVKDASQVQDLIYRTTYKQALYTPASELQSAMKSKLGLDPALQGPAFREAVEQLPEGLREIGERAMWGYGGDAGKTKIGSFFGKDFGVKNRGPGWRSLGDQVSRVFHDTPGGSKLMNAWWGINNRGIIGDIRKKIGVYNPYQKYLRQIELQTKRDAEFLTNQYARKYVYGKNPDKKITAAAQWLIEQEEELADVAVKAGITRGRRPAAEIMEQAIKSGKTPKPLADIILKDPEAAIKEVEHLRSITDELRHVETQWAAKGFSETGEISNYIPKVYRKQGEAAGTMGASFQKTRSYTREQSREVIAKKFEKTLGLRKEDALELVDSGITDYVTDIDELMIARIIAHSKMESKVNMLLKFAELGTPIENLGEDIVSGAGHKIVELGLKEIPHPALKGMLFDKDVADIIERAITSTGKDMGKLQRVFANYTKWWRGLVTMTTGFHIRNFNSNNFTGFLKHGMKWFELDQYAAPAVAGVIYAQKLGNPEQWLKQFGMDDKTYSKMLNRTFGEGKARKTLKELVDIARQKGVIGESQAGFDPLSLSQKLAQGDRFAGKTINPLPTGILTNQQAPKEFIGFGASRSVGNIVENTPRFQSFLIDFDDIAKNDTGRIETLIKDGLLRDTPEDIAKATNYAVDYAALEAKKWFIDYDDLTEFERGTLKNIIPFYTWLRRNLANQLSGIVMYPGMYALVPKAEEVIKFQDPEYDESLVPDYMKQLGYIPVSKFDNKIFNLLNPNLPFQDIARIPVYFEDDESWVPRVSWKEMKDDMMGAAHPIIKSVVEMIPDKGYDTWRKKDLDNRAVAPGILRAFTKTPRLLQTVDGILRYAGFERGLDPRINEEGKLELNAKLLKLLENNMPLIRTTDQILQTAATVQGYLPQDEALMKAYEEMTQEKTEFDALNRFFNVLSYWGGIKERAVDMTKEEERRQKDIYGRAGEMYNDRLLNQTEIQKRLTRKQKDTERIRKLTR